MTHRDAIPTSTREAAGFELTSGLAQLIGYDAELLVTGGELDDLTYGLALACPDSHLLVDLCAAQGRDLAATIRVAESLRADRLEREAGAERVPA